MRNIQGFSRIRLQRFRVRDFRNLEDVDLEPNERFSVIFGNNGQGKTSLLEAIYVSLTSRSFRTAKTKEALRWSSEATDMCSEIVEDHQDGQLVRKQQVTISSRGTALRIDDNEPANVTEFALRSPVVVFHADEMELSQGSAQGRRRLLDRIALYQSQSAAYDRTRYARSLKARQRLLLAGAFRDPSLDAFERLIAEHGSRLIHARRGAALALAQELKTTFEGMAAKGAELVCEYQPGGSNDVLEFQKELVTNRTKDARLRSASVGPHRDELGLRLDGHTAKLGASQGQHRMITLALKAAEAQCIRLARGLEPLLLLDDISSELDDERTDALFSYLERAQGQVILTTTRPDLIRLGEQGKNRLDIKIVEGKIASELGQKCQ